MTSDEARAALAGLFPSPFGVHVLKCKRTSFDEDEAVWFPSPFGVHVLKSKNPEEHGAVGYYAFRPLSGFTF